jgi:hypothetical protein
MHHPRRLAALVAFALLAGCSAEESELDYTGKNQSEDTAESEQAVINAYGTIFNTGGINLNVRSTPSTGGTIITSVPEGTQVGIECQTTGTTVEGTNVWDFLPGYGGYVTDAYVLTGYDGFIPGMPMCGGGGLVVNGTTLNANQDQWVRWIAANTVPKLSGTRDQRLTKASRVTWWSLKEGVLSLSNPLPYSNCNNVHVGPTYVCSAGYAWQVGISGIQPGNVSLSSSESTALALYPGWTIQDVLANAAVAAGYPSGTSTYNSIVASTGSLRNSWLLRQHAVAFTHQEPIIYSECITNSYSWCYGTGWAETAAFAPNKSAALNSISQIKSILSSLAP